MAKALRLFRFVQTPGWQRRSASKAPDTSSMASQPSYCRGAPSLSPREERVGREPEGGDSQQSRNRSPKIQNMPPLPDPLLRGAEEREKNAAAEAVRLLESFRNAGRFTDQFIGIGYKRLDSSLSSGWQKPSAFLFPTLPFCYGSFTNALPLSDTRPPPLRFIRYGNGAARFRRRSRIENNKQNGEQ